MSYKTTSSQSSKTNANMQVPISEHVMVLEKEFKTKKGHTDKITCLSKTSPSEFMTSSLDQSFKIWDKDLQGCRYTIETHEPLHTMNITGEKGNILISGLGENDFIVFGLEDMAQNHIFPGAHDGKIVQIITLGKFQNKYFATRCQYGDLGIWGANKHPDRVLRIDNMDDAEYPQGQDTARSIDEPKKKKEIDPNDSDLFEHDEDGARIQDDDGNDVLKKEEVKVVKKDFSNRVASDKDRVIEMLEVGDLIVQGSATLMAVSSYNQKLVYVSMIDLKNRRQTHIKAPFMLNNRPTQLYQIDANNLLVGTEGGKIEQWSLMDNSRIKTYDAHPESDAGISAIIELKTQSELLRGSGGDFKLIATASEGAKEFRLWKLDLQNATLNPYLKIETTLTGGIKYLLETQDTQIAAANESELKFYDFVDKREKEKKEAEKKKKASNTQKMKECFEHINLSPSSNKINR